MWFSLVVPMLSDVFLGWIQQSETGPVDYIQFPRWRQQIGSSYTVHNCASDAWFFDWFRLLQTCTMWIIQKKTWWAIIAKVTNISHILFVYWPMLKRSTVPWPASGPLEYSKMAVTNLSSLRLNRHVRVHKHRVTPQRSALSRSCIIIFKQSLTQYASWINWQCNECAHLIT